MDLMDYQKAVKLKQNQGKFVQKIKEFNTSLSGTSSSDRRNEVDR